MSSMPNRVGAQGIVADRALGTSWEQQFIHMAELFGFEGWQVSKLRGPTMEWRGRRYISPDVWLLRRGDLQFACEVKHKSPTALGSYGLEVYRAESLIDLQQHFVNQYGGVTSLYVIHDWSRNADRASTRNVIHHWCAQRMDVLQQHILGPFVGKTYYNGAVCERPINYYTTSLFVPLIGFLV